MTLLPTGKILAWGKFEAGTQRMANPRLWNPAAGSPTTAVTVRADTMLFCAGQTLMADGRVMVSGGHKEDDRGLDVTNIFDPVTETWASGLPKMALGRWYPTVTTMSDGRVVTVAGRDANSNEVLVPEIWENNRWVRLPGASLKYPYYPRQFLAPNGKLFYAGERVRSRWLDVDISTANGRGKWTSSASLDHVWKFNRDYGSAAMYDTGKILYVGGGGDPNWSTTDPKASAPTATAETIDLNVTGPRWTSTDPMHFARRHLNATILPDGHVLVTGGTTAGGFNTISGAVARGGGLESRHRAAGRCSPATPSIASTIRSRCSCRTAPCSTARAATPTFRARPIRIRGRRTTRSSARRTCSRARGRRSRACPRRRSATARRSR